MISKKIGVVIALSVTCANPAFAQQSDIVVSARSNLRSIEYQYDGADRLQHARTLFDQLIPIGSPVSDARRNLEKSGAHCKSKVGETSANCMYYSFEGIDDHLRDVVWTVHLDTNAEKVSHVEIGRESVGP